MLVHIYYLYRSFFDKSTQKSIKQRRYPPEHVSVVEERKMLKKAFYFKPAGVASRGASAPAATGASTAGALRVSHDFRGRMPLPQKALYSACSGNRPYIK